MNIFSRIIAALFPPPRVDREQLAELIENARNNPPSDAELEAQRRSWVRGEMAMGLDAQEQRIRDFIAQENAAQRKRDAQRLADRARFDSEWE